MLAGYEPPGTNREKGTNLLSRPWHRFALVAFAAVVCAPSFSQDLPPNDTERRAAMDAYHDCRVEKANLIDDGISDALTVGNSVAAACRPEMEHMADVLSEGKNRRVRSMVIERLERSAGEDASTIVMLERNRRRASQSHQDTPDQPDATTERETAAREQLTTGAHLKAACEAVGEEWNKCSAFIRGVFMAYGASTIDRGRSQPYCLPERYVACFSVGNRRVDFLDSHWEMTQEPAALGNRRKMVPPPARVKEVEVAPLAWSGMFIIPASAILFARKIIVPQNYVVTLILIGYLYFITT